jgi:hypothetical protein
MGEVCFPAILKSFCIYTGLVIGEWASGERALLLFEAPEPDRMNYMFFIGIFLTVSASTEQLRFV